MNGFRSENRYLHTNIDSGNAFLLIMQAGAVLKVNLSIERHASKIYTRAMFEQFGLYLFESGYYRVEEVEKRRRYLTRHVNSDAREKWCKVVFEVTVDEHGEWFTCVCGNFEHTGMLCSHTLKV
jgi:hypothetical protein